MNENADFSLDELRGIVNEIKHLAIKYYQLTGKPLGITGEIGEFEAADKLNLVLQEARTPGYDAIRIVGDREEKIQIKSRRVISVSKSSQRIGSINLKHDFDKVVLVLLDGNFELIRMYEADRCNVEKAIKKPGSKARNIRGALSINQFKNISKLIWERYKE